MTPDSDFARRRGEKYSNDIDEYKKKLNRAGIAIQEAGAIASRHYSTAIQGNPEKEN